MERNQKDDSFRLNSGLLCLSLLSIYRCFILLPKTILKISTIEIEKSKKLILK